MDLGRYSMATTWVWVNGQWSMVAWVWVGGFGVVCDGGLIWFCVGLLGLG